LPPVTSKSLETSIFLFACLLYSTEVLSRLLFTCGLTGEEAFTVCLEGDVTDCLGEVGDCFTDCLGEVGLGSERIIVPLLGIGGLVDFLEEAGLNVLFFE